jgi:hypothetical protein
MSVRPLHSLLLAGCLLASVASSAAGADQAEIEINYLLDHVADSGCTFVRNGDSHDSADAADHLRLKYDRGQRYADTAENFIDRLASESSWSGDIYTVTCDQVTEPSGVWLHRALEEYRAQ